MSIGAFLPRKCDAQLVCKRRPRDYRGLRLFLVHLTSGGQDPPGWDWFRSPHLLPDPLEPELLLAESLLPDSFEPEPLLPELLLPEPLTSALAEMSTSGNPIPPGVTRLSNLSSSRLSGFIVFTPFFLHRYFHHHR